MIKLLFDSIISPFFKTPLYLISYAILCVLGIKKWRLLFDSYENMTSQNRVCFIKTLYLNYRALPYRQARKLPIYVFSDVKIISLAGSISFDGEDLTQGMVRWGWFHTFRSQGKTIINIRGTLKLGGGGRFLKGSEIVVWDNANLVIGKGFFIGENSTIYCWKNIVAGEYLRLSYQSQIFDTDFHYSINITTGKVHPKDCRIQLGAYNWIGCRTTIKKGTITPDHLTVAASGSVLTKNYLDSIPCNSVIGGTPAKLLRTGYSRIWNQEYSRMATIDKWYMEHSLENIFTYDLSESNIKDFSTCK